MTTEIKGTTVAVIGLGYIGLPTAACLADNGYRVFGVDIDKNVVDTVRLGSSHIIEPGLDESLKRGIAKGNLTVSLTISICDIYIICVPTPLKREKNRAIADLRFLKQAFDAICPLLKKGDTVILESTSPVGTTEQMFELLKTRGAPVEQISLGYCPERVLPGNTMVELVRNSRIIGGVDSKSSRAIADFYKTFVTGAVIETDAATAELSKLVENSYRDVNIAFANEIQKLAFAYNVDAWKLMEVVNQHPRVDMLKPGIGVGGHCIAVDPWFLIADDHCETKLMRVARELNDCQPEWVVKRVSSMVSSFCEANGRTPWVACLGLTYKADIDDLRDSPAVKIVQLLINQGLHVKCVEPNLAEHHSFDLVSLEEAIVKSDLMLVLVNHKQFKGLKARLASASSPLVVDFCGY